MENRNDAPEMEATARSPMTPAEIARLEREAALRVAAGGDAQSVPAPEPEEPAPQYAYDEPEIGDEAPDDDDAPAEWVPSRFEKRVHAIPEKRWRLYQALAGVVVGAFTVAALFWGGTGISPMLLAALVLVLVAPRILEDRGRRKLTWFRITLVIVLLVGVGALTIYTGVTKGWHLFTREAEGEAALRMLDTL